MNQYFADVENGKEIIRHYGINLSYFKNELSKILHGTKVLGEDEWVDMYNVYASCVGRTGMESIKDWANEFYQEFKKDVHRIWLKK